MKGGNIGSELSKDSMIIGVVDKPDTLQSLAARLDAVAGLPRQARGSRLRAHLTLLSQIVTLIWQVRTKLPPAKNVTQRNASGIILTSRPHPLLNTTRNLD